MRSGAVWSWVGAGVGAGVTPGIFMSGYFVGKLGLYPGGPEYLYHNFDELRLSPCLSLNLLQSYPAVEQVSVQESVLVLSRSRCWCSSRSRCWCSSRSRCWCLVGAGLLTGVALKSSKTSPVSLSTTTFFHADIQLYHL